MLYIPKHWSWQECNKYKHELMQHYRDTFNLETFVETGTCEGDTVEAVRPYFKNIYSIELHPNRYERCVNRFSGINNIHLFLGDSEVILSELLNKLPNRNILFWLDAHAGG
jgi:hypothetical protein